MSATNVVATPLSVERVKRAVDKHFYFKIADKNNAAKISGAAKVWESNPRMTYVPSIRIVGTPEEISQYLTNNHKPAQDIANWIASGYNVVNLQNPILAQQYQQELASYVAYQASQPKTEKKTAVDFAKYRVWRQQIDDVGKPGGATLLKASKTSKGGGGGSRAGRVKPLWDKFLEVRGTQKVIDVSNMLANGSKTGTLKENPSLKAGSKSRKKAASGLPEIVSSKRETFTAAMNMLTTQSAAAGAPMDFTQYLPQWELVSSGQFTAPMATAGFAVAAPVLSPATALPQVGLGFASAIPVLPGSP